MSRTQYQHKPSAFKRPASSNDSDDNYCYGNDTGIIMEKRVRLRSTENENEGDGSLAEEMLLAIRARNSELSKELIGTGADVNGSNERVSLLTEAVIVGNIQCVKMLLAAGVNVNRDDRLVIIKTLVEQNNLKCLKVFLRSGKTKDLKTACILFAKMGHAHFLHLLILVGANVNSVDKDGFTLLMWTAIRGHCDCMKVLIDEGADVNKIDKSGRTALIFTINHEHYMCTSLLLRSGANVNVTDNNWNSALITAVRKDVDLPVIQSLIETGADVNIRDTNG